jgi:hypothetical protein
LLDFIHIGLHKTGSSWLQSALFKYHPEIELLVDFAQGMRFARTPPESFDLESWRSTFEMLLKNQEGREVRTGISNEWLSGHGVTAHYREEDAQRISNLFGKLKIIVILRHPQSYISSQYNQEVRGGSSLTIREWLGEYSIGLAKVLDFRALINLYMIHFGSEQVLFLPFELLREDEVNFVMRICEFIGVNSFDVSSLSGHTIRRNVSVSWVALEIMRLQNKVLDLTGPRTLRKRILQRGARIVGTARIFPKPGLIEPAILREHPALEQLLQNENYTLWTDDLARFNYRFP